MAFITQNISLATAPLGITVNQLHLRVEEHRSALRELTDDLRLNKRPAFSIVERDDDLPPALAYARSWRQEFEHVLILGFGGSTLGGQMLYQFAGGSLFAKGPKLHFIDYVDPHVLDALLETLPLHRTGVVVISKSGTTIEVLVQALRAADAYNRHGIPLSQNWLAITELKDSPLQRLCANENIPVLEHDAGIGGRYSVLSNVGLLPAALMGLEGTNLRAGARDALREFLGNPFESAPAVGAALAVVAAEQNITTTVVMPYGQQLRVFPQWVAQLWAESLGKDGKGTLPFAAVGPADQHSVLQLFMQGPPDKLYTLIVPDTRGTGVGVEEVMAQKVLAPHLSNLQSGTLMHAQAMGTAQALHAAGRAVRLLETPLVSEHVLGALIMHYMLETIIAAAMWNVNPYDQPGVEEGKQRTLQLLFERRQTVRE